MCMQYQWFVVIWFAVHLSLLSTNIDLNKKIGIVVYLIS